MYVWAYQYNDDCPTPFWPSGDTLSARQGANMPNIPPRDGVSFASNLEAALQIRNTFVEQVDDQKGALQVRILQNICKDLG